MADTSKYTIEERLIVSVWVHEKERSGETYEEIRENFFLRFNKAAPSEANLRNLEKKTFSTGSVLDAKRSGRPKKYCGDDVCNRLTESLERSPMKSTRKRSAEMQIPRTSLRRWMKDEGYHAYKPTTINELSDQDMETRRDACQSLLSAFPTLEVRRNVMMTDECAVYLSCRSRNVYLWAKNNPHFFEEIQQHPPHVMMWAGVTSEIIIGPYFFETSVNGASYLEMLSHWLVPELDRVGILNTVVLQQDGAPGHFWNPVRKWLSTSFPTWIGRGGPLIWPPRSPDLTTCDNWLWSYLKENLGKIRMDSVDQLKREIIRIFSTITPEMLRRASRRTWRRIQLCMENDGAHTETLDV